MHISTTFIGKIVLAILKKLWSSKDSLAKKHFGIFKVLNNIGQIKPDDSFDYLYNITLHELSFSGNKSIIKAFTNDAVKDSFKQAFRDNDFSLFNSLFEQQCNAIEELKNYSFNAQYECQNFISRFEKELENVKSPTQIESSRESSKSNRQIDQMHQMLNVDEYFENEFKTAKKLIEDHKPKEALDFINNYKDLKWKNLGDEKKSEIHINIAFCHLHLNNIDEASEHLLNAFNLDKENVKTRGLVSYSYLLQKDISKAELHSRKCLFDDPLNIFANIVKIHLDSRKKDIQDIENDLKEELLSNSSILFALQHIARNQGNFEKASDISKKAYLLDKKNLQSSIMYVENELQLILDKIKLNPIQLNEIDNSKISHLIDILDEAWGQVKNGSIDQTKISIVQNLSTLHDLNQNSEKALFFIQMAYDIDSNDTYNIRNLILQFCREKNLKGARKIIETKIEIVKNDIELISFAGEVYSGVDQYDKVIELYNGNIKFEEEYHTQYYSIAIFWSLALTHSNDTSSLDALYKELEEKYPTKILAIQSRVACAKYFGKTIDKDLLIKGKELLQQHKHRHSEVFHFSIDLFNEGLFEASKELLESIVIKNIYSDELQLYCKCLIELEEYRLLDEITSNISGNELNPRIVDIKSYLFEKKGDIESAIETLDHFLSHKKDPHLETRFITLHYNKNNYNFLQQYFETYEIDENLSNEIKLHLINILVQVVDFDKSIDKLINFWRRNPHNHEANTLVFQTIGKAQRESKSIETIIPNCTIFIKSTTDDETRMLFITDEPLLNSEIGIDTSIGKDLLSKKVGDKIEIDKTFEIISIKDQIIFALRTAEENALKKFPESGIKKFSFAEGDLENPLSHIGKLLAGKENYTNKIIEKYNQRIFPIGACANLFKKTIILFWQAVITDEKLGLIMTHSQDTFLQAKEELKDVLLLSPTAFFLLHRTSTINIVTNNFKKVFIHQSTLDDIKSEIESREQQIKLGSDSFDISSNNGVPRVNKLTKEQNEFEIKKLQQMIKFIESNIEIKAIESSLNFKNEEIDKNEQAYSKPYSDFIIDNDNTFTRVSGDGVITAIINQEQKQFPLTVCDLIFHFYETGKIETKQISDFTRQCILMNISSFRFTYEIVWEIIEFYKYDTSSNELIKCLSIFSKKNTIPGYSIKVAVDVLYKIYSQLTIEIVKEQLTRIIIDYIISKESTLDEMRFFLNLVEQKFTMLQIDRDKIIRNCRTRFTLVKSI